MTEPETLFTYEMRPNCACGAPLDNAGPIVEKQTDWGDVTFIQCKVCGSFGQSPQITPGSLVKWYESTAYWGGSGSKGAGYGNYEQDEASRRVDAIARCRRDIARSLKPGASILEIGCASGTLVRALRDAGYDAHGLDLSRRLAAMAEEINQVTISVGDLTEMKYAESSFDAVLVLGTISNLYELPDQLELVHRVLRPGGLLYFNYPAASSLMMRLYGSRSWMFTPSVCNFLTRRGCKKILTNAGFEMTKSRIDFQRPSLSKLFGHARISPLENLVDRLGMASKPTPLPIPIPGVRAVWARRTSK